MKLWSTIETIIKTDDSKIIIKRISFFYEDRQLYKELLDSMRNARNINAHTGVKPFNVELKNFALNHFINRLLLFFINNPFKYNKVDQVITAISLPTDLQSINAQIKNLQIVKKFCDLT